ncbi:MAG: hypothetical protein JRJ09_18830 [Deltaproteobacteria bacterium]|nr:hypothetical protein [Deltaproteobacteria bacterium]
MSLAVPILLEFPDPDLVADRDARYGLDHYFDEPHNEPVTVKFTPSMKRRLQHFAKTKGYTNLSVAVRELIALGLECWPEKARQEALATLKALEEDI